MANQIAWNKSIQYAYMHHEGSITTKSFSADNLYILEICRSYLKKYDYDQELVRAAKAYMLNCCLRVYIEASDIEEFSLYSQECVNYINSEWKCVLFDPNIRRKLRLAILLYKISPRLLKNIHSKINRWD